MNAAALAQTIKQRVKQRREWILVPLAYLVLVGALYHTMWLAPDKQPRQVFGWDTPEAYWPDMAYFARSLSHGDAPLWNPYNRGGYAFYADLLPGVFYPPNWPFIAPGAVFDSMPLWAAQLKMLLHHVVGGLLLYVFLRRRKLPWPACFFAGAAFVLSVPMIIHKASALLWGLVWAPLLLYLVDIVIDGARARGWWWRGVALGGALWVSGSAGMPQGSFMAILLAFIYGGVRLAQHLLDAHRASQLKPAAIAQARAFAVAGVTAIVLLAIVVVPSLHEAAGSATRGATRDLGYVLTFRVPQGSLLGMLAPTAGRLDMYGGLLVLVLAATGLAVPRADRGAPLIFAGTALFGVLLAHGANGALLPWLAQHAPGFSLFREPNRYKLIVTMSLAVLAGYGVAALLGDDARSRRRALITFAAAIAACAIGVGIAKAATSQRDPNVPGFALSFEILAACAVIAVAFWRAPQRYLPLAACALVIVQYIDISHFAARSIALRETPGHHDDDYKYVADLPGVDSEWRIWDEFVIGRRAGSRLLVRDLRGYVASDPFDTVRYDELRTRLRTNPELVAAFNVRWVLWAPHPTRGTGDHIMKRPPDEAVPDRFHRIDNKHWEVVDPAPLVAWYGAVDIVPDHTHALAALTAREHVVGQRRRAILEAGDRPRDLAGTDQVTDAPASVPGTLISYSPNRIEVAIDAPTPGVVVLDEVFAAGWDVEIDGQPADPFRIELILRGVTVGAGHHVMVWSYHPPHLLLLFVLWIAGVLALLAAAGFAWRARKSASF